MSETAPITTTMRRWRVVLGVLGATLLLTGGLTFLNDVPSSRYPGVAAWLLGALILHDGVVALAIFAVSV